MSIHPFSTTCPLTGITRKRSGVLEPVPAARGHPRQISRASIQRQRTIYIHIHTVIHHIHPSSKSMPGLWEEAKCLEKTQVCLWKMFSFKMEKLLGKLFMSLNASEQLWGDINIVRTIIFACDVSLINKVIKSIVVWIWCPVKSNTCSNSCSIISDIFIISSSVKK